MNSILLKKLPLYYTLVVILLTSALAYIVTNYFDSKEKNKIIELSEANNSCTYNIERLKGYPFIKPIMFVDDVCEGDDLATIKKEITTLIESYKNYQGVISASAYIKEFNHNEWIAVNEEEKYEPGSLFKVPILIAYLKMNEEHQGVLDKEISFNQSFSIDKVVAFKSKSIVLGKSYTVRELLKYMIVYSDNNATALLNNNLKPEVLIKLFKDLDLDLPNVNAKQYFFTTKQYSLFMRAIFNASYLSIDDSEYAAELLNKCEFNDGIRKGVPASVKMAHKFGESGTPSEKQLHESAIVYVQNRPYLITVMTKGKDNAILSKLISEISALVYKDQANKSI
jgi:beta-lactamase class A